MAAAGGLALPRRETFEVHLGVYEGPFDLLLGLIGKRLETRGVIMHDELPRAIGRLEAAI